MRSVHLERDIRDPNSSRGYVLTPVARDALARITTGFQPNSTQRAWRLAGDYGSGKTAFGLALARVARGAKNELPRELQQFMGHRSTFHTVMATAESENLGVTVLRALGVKWHARRAPAVNEVMAAVHEAVARAKQRRHVGVLLIVDELGKNLEHAARHPESDDIFLLQRLAEEAARSGARAFSILVMLHQGVAAYTSSLDSAAKREWNKVAGRFEEIVYAHPIEQVAALVAATLNVDTNRLPIAVRKEAETAMAAALKLGLYGSSAAATLRSLGTKIFPIHPTALPVLVRTIRRFGQNERSLFSFISSAEPLGLQHHLEHSTSNFRQYRIHHLLDYVRANLLQNLATSGAHTHWGIVDGVLASTRLENRTQESVLKTVALLNLLDAADLPATEDMVLQAVDSDRKATQTALDALRRRGVIYERGSVKGMCLWPHTSVNVDELFAKALAAGPGEGNGVELLCKHIRSEHLVPRAYYARTGTLRYAAVEFVPAKSLTALLAAQPRLDGKSADLNVRVVLPADKSERNEAITALRAAATSLAEGLLVGVAEPNPQAVAALRDLVAWEWVRKNTPQLSGDRYAREEVSRQISQAERNLTARLGGLGNLAVPNVSELFWVSSSMARNVKVGRELLTILGEECDRIYPKTPRVLNELINRRTPSKAAVAARTKLVEAMALSSEKPNLGMEDTSRPAEMGLYLSIVKAGGFHVEAGSRWAFRLPEKKADKCRLLPAIHLITHTITRSGLDALVPVQDVFDALSRPPFGIREGLQPFILAIYLATHHQRVALYEDGTYLHEVRGDEFLRLMKEPQHFHLQHCELDLVRSEVFARLLRLLEVSPRDATRTDLLDLVRPLVVFVGREIPEFSRRTNSLSATAVRVRRALLDTREPVNLVFTKLPEACGLPAVGTKPFAHSDDLAARLRIALHEIRAAYPELIKRLGEGLCAAFDVTVGLPEARAIVAGRAAQLAVALTEPSLKAFALRVADSNLDDRTWIESIASLLARKAPERWSDNDETEFNHQLEVTAARFKRTEAALIGTTRKLNGHACRIALTKSDGAEVGDLVDWAGMDESRIGPVQTEIQQLLSQHGRHGLAAAMRALWIQLSREEEGIKL
jgi:hypothetical protein